MATKLFQQSAGIFNYLKGATPAAIPQEPTPDLNPDTLQVLSSLMLAQAQEIFVVKAIRGRCTGLTQKSSFLLLPMGHPVLCAFEICSDNMKDAVIAKLACQCEELYAEALRGLQKDSIKSVWDKEWIPTVSFA